MWLAFLIFSVFFLLLWHYRPPLQQQNCYLLNRVRLIFNFIWLKSPFWLSQSFSTPSFLFYGPLSRFYWQLTRVTLSLMTCVILTERPIWVTSDRVGRFISGPVINYYYYYYNHSEIEKAMKIRPMICWPIKTIHLYIYIYIYIYKNLTNPGDIQIIAMYVCIPGVSNLISFGSYFLKMKAAESHRCYTILKSLKYQSKLLYTAVKICWKYKKSTDAQTEIILASFMTKANK